MSEFDLEAYHARAVENIVSDALKTLLQSPKQSIFLAQFAQASKRSTKLRQQSAEQGQHIPPFLIASITSQCNLHCAGCYARAHQTCGDCAGTQMLDADAWDHIFAQAEALGISFILLAGGEPLLRNDVLEKAAAHPKILFPIFTNGTMLHGMTLAMFDKHRNLVPILSIEGDAAHTDARRGAGVYDQLITAMDALQAKHILFGASITVTSENLTDITGAAFLTELQKHGCKVAILVEYVPVDASTTHLALSDDHRQLLTQHLEVIRNSEETMLYVSFPGDELESGGCLAAGRGFFHINATGGAEPCPFSPYSDTNLRDHTLLDALNSSLFTKLTSGDYLTEPHEGGCVLFAQQETVSAMVHK